MLINVHTHFETGLSLEILNQQGSPSCKSFFSAGIHPKDSMACEMNQTTALAANLQCLAIGECGLDKIIDIPLEIQQTVFEAQIRLSEQTSLPLMLHCVKAWNEVLQTRKRLNPEQPWIFHGFRKTAILSSVLKEGLMVSIGTAVLYDEKLQEIIPFIPDERLFLETDSDKQHSIAEVYAKVADLKHMPLEKLEESIHKNFTNTFPRFKTYF